MSWASLTRLAFDPRTCDQTTLHRLPRMMWLEIGEVEGLVASGKRHAEDARALGGGQLDGHCPTSAA